MVEIRRLYVFLALFTFVYFLESIGGTYMVTAVQNIERHFQIPSKLSGFLVSAHDVSYVFTVILVSYYGSRGNRAKWIGCGTILMAIAHIFTASPNFLFPSTAPQLNLTQVEDRLRPSDSLLSHSFPSSNQHLIALLDYAPLRDRLPARLRQMLFSALEHPEWLADASVPLSRPMLTNYSQKSLYSLDEPLISEILWRSDALISASNEVQRKNASAALESAMQLFVRNRQEKPESDLKTMRRAAVAPFAFCHQLVNQLRGMLQNIKCHRQTSNLAPLFVIFGAMLILGFGRTMPWSLGIPLIDDNVKRQQMPIYFAMINFFKILGPICGFLIGSVANKLYYTFPAPAPKGLTPQDPTWIGAWWLGFLFIGLVMIGPSIALFYFPETSRRKKKEFKNGGLKSPLNTSNGKVGAIKTTADGQPQQQKANGSSAAKEGGGGGKERQKLALFDRHVESGHGGKQGFRAFLYSYREVLNSRVYVGASVARVLDVLAFKGYMVFLPKYLENHFGIPQYRVHIYMAFFGVLGFALGAASGGFITRHLRLNGRKAAAFILVVSVINTSLFGLKSLLGCHSIVNSIGRDQGQEVADNNFPVGPPKFDFTRECNADCGCHVAKLYPVCDATGQVFYSPCHAGCRHVECLLMFWVIDLDKYQLEFSECDCVADGGMVSKDLCRDDCTFMRYAFFGTIVVGAFVAGTGVVPGMLLLLRSVPPQTRSPALGLQGFLVSLVGTLPSPILWGWLIDSTCKVWDHECNNRGACQIYDPWALRMRMHWLYVGIRLFSLVADIYVCVHAKGLNLQEEEEEVRREAETTAGTQETFTLEAIPT